MSKPGQFYRLHPARTEMVTTGPTEAEDEILGLHFAYLESLAARGIIMLAGRTQNGDERTFGIVILCADSEQDARRIMLDDPAVKAGIMLAELFPFKVALFGKARGGTA